MTGLTFWKSVQQKLVDLGYKPGPIDGQVGLKTRAAVRAFQKDNKLLADGVVGPVTQGALGVLTNTPAKSITSKSRLIHTLVWHCTAAREGVWQSKDDIIAMHKALGWSTIGYHGLVLLDGTFIAGRPESQIGAHVGGHNLGTIGYSYVGGLAAEGDARNPKTAKDTRTDAQKATMIDKTRNAIIRLQLRTVLGHRDLSPDLDQDGLVEPHEWVKVCPCFNVIAEYGNFLHLRV